jgi:enoyl-CoA hydratase/carnithine racemase
MSVLEAEFSQVSVVVEHRVCWATIDAPPVNVMTIALLMDLIKLANEVAADDGVGALVLQSADPDFFIAHFDVEAILKFPVDGEA